MRYATSRNVSPKQRSHVLLPDRATQTERTSAWYFKWRYPQTTGCKKHFQDSFKLLSGKRYRHTTLGYTTAVGRTLQSTSHGTSPTPTPTKYS
eukprot:5895543-Pyramimonas_sp.AAC.1